MIRQALTLANSFLSWLETWPSWINGLLCRWGVAGIFWRSGQTKVHGFFQIDASTFDLFRDEYHVPLVPPDIAAVMATISEHLFSVLLVIGLASRLSAGALLFMTLVIEIFVYPESWPDHLMWASALVYVILRGPGKVSLDHLLFGKLRE
jgi:putative oxidoreductase